MRSGSEARHQPGGSCGADRSSVPRSFGCMLASSGSGGAVDPARDPNTGRTVPADRRLHIRERAHVTNVRPGETSDERVNDGQIGDGVIQRSIAAAERVDVELRDVNLEVSLLQFAQQSRSDFVRRSAGPVDEPPASPYVIMRRVHPYRGENSGPGKAGRWRTRQLTPRPGIREQKICHKRTCE
jgi:hypothetical protein